MPVTVCCVTSCLAKDITMFCFPRERNMQTLWLLHVGPHSSDLLQLSHEQLTKKKVCIQHFESQYLEDFKRKYNGYPTLFTEEEIRIGVPNRPSVTVFTGDHTYCKRWQNIELPETIKTAKLSEEQVPGTSSSQNMDPGVLNVPLSTEKNAIDLNKGDKCDSTVFVRSKSRLVSNVQSLTPRCRKLYYKCKSIIKGRKLFASSTDFKQNIANAETLRNTKSFQKLVEKLDIIPKKFIKLQLRLAGKTMKSRRYNEEEKLMSIALYKQSPKGYSLLQKLFALPTKRTLNRVLQNINFEEGINKNIFSLISLKVKTWSNAKKLCSIVFDEVQLSAHLNFISSHDYIEGFVKGNGLPKFADHALVIMLRGICASWRQAVAYYFCEGTTPAIILKNILKEIVSEVVQTGLKPLTFICDQGATSQRALRDLEQETKQHCLENNTYFDGSILIGGCKISIIYDPPHLIKGIRNNMLNKNLMFEGKLTKWDDIVDVYNNDCKLGDIRMLPKLTEEHVIPEKIKKMKVKNCTQVFSERVAATMQYTATFFAGKEVIFYPECLHALQNRSEEYHDMSGVCLFLLNKAPIAIYKCGHA